jgi:hypothetical protein
MENLKKEVAEKDAKIRELESKIRYDGMMSAVGDHLLAVKNDEIELLNHKLFSLESRIRRHTNTHKCARLPGLTKQPHGVYVTKF